MASKKVLDTLAISKSIVKNAAGSAGLVEMDSGAG